MNKWYSLALVLLVVTLLLAPAVGADSVNLILNGSFEDEYSPQGVSKYWTAFNNGGPISYGYHDDTWSKTVWDGARSQLLEVHTKGMTGSQSNRYSGIYQVVNVVPDARYMFSLYGMIRSTEGTEKESKWNYRVQVGFDYNGGTDPWAVTEWTEMPWPEYPRLSPGYYQSYAHSVVPSTDKLTVFIRVWKKFPTTGQEGDINIDAVSLVGPARAAAPVAAAPAPVKAPLLPNTGAGDMLPLLGLGLAAVAVGLTGARLLRRR
jgi:hypothetical protein